MGAPTQWQIENRIDGQPGFPLLNSGMKQCGMCRRFPKNLAAGAQATKARCGMAKRNAVAVWSDAPACEKFKDRRSR